MYVEDSMMTGNAATGQKNHCEGMQMIKVKISASPNKRMTGVELRRVMAFAGLTPYALAKRLGWYRRRIQRMMKVHEFDLHPTEMAELLKALGATSL